MILSMTGYGSAQHAADGVSYAVEIRTVNNRYLKLSIRMPETLQFAEASVEKLLRARINRGSVDYALRIRGGDMDAPCTVNTTCLQWYATQLSNVSLPGQVHATVDLAALAGLPGVCRQPEVADELRARQKEILEQLTQSALESVAAMRRDEGQALRRDLLATCENIRGRLAEIASRAPNVIEEYHLRLQARVATLLKTAKIDLESEGLMREVALFAERCDISEELTRLTSHLDQFLELCDRADQVGRTMDFLTQELLREANTIASKSNDALIVRNVVEIKGMIDRLREQVQNVE